MKKLQRVAVALATVGLAVSGVVAGCRHDYWVKVKRARREANAEIDVPRRTPSSRPGHLSFPDRDPSPANGAAKRLRPYLNP